MVDRGRQDQGQRRDRSPFSLVLDTTDATKKDVEWEMVATATVLYHRRHAPRPPKEVIFQVDGTEVERLPTNDESGQAVTTIIFPQPGSYFVGAFLADEPGVRYVKRIGIKAEEKRVKIPSAEKSRATFSGEDGKQQITIVLVAEDGSPVSNFVGTITKGNVSEAFTTDQSGAALCRLDFQEESQCVEVVAGSFHKRMRVLGPLPTS